MQVIHLRRPAELPPAKTGLGDLMIDSSTRQIKEARRKTVDYIFGTKTVLNEFQLIFKLTRLLP